jgi:serine/threonine protein kinase
LIFLLSFTLSSLLLNLISFSSAFFAAKYELCKQIGEGSYGVVFEAIDRKTKEKRAIKFIDLKKFQNKSHYAETEVQIIQSLQAAHHPNLITLYDVSRIDSWTTAMVMELCTEDTLASFLKKFPGKRIDESQAKKFMQDIASSLSLLKSRNIIHRDLKPDNFLLTRTPTGELQLKLADFGFAKQLSSFDELVPSIVGTPVYVAPEIWRQLPYTSKSDLWSVGVIFFEMLSGYKVFYAQSIPALKRLIREKEVRYPPILFETCSPLCIDLLQGLLQKDPAKRITWDEFLNHEWLELEPRFCVFLFFSFLFFFFFSFFFSFNFFIFILFNNFFI